MICVVGVLYVHVVEKYIGFQVLIGGGKMDRFQIENLIYELCETIDSYDEIPNPDEVKNQVEELIWALIDED